MQRITQQDLDNLVNTINKMTGNPMTYSNPESDKINIGHYHLDYAYGGVKLVRTMNDKGGIKEISSTGYGTKRELFNWMKAYISGICIAA